MKVKKITTICIALTAMLPITILNAQNMEKENRVPQHLSTFPIGEENVQYAKFFIGKSYLAPLTSNKELNTPICNVTFEPGCRNNWHSHTGGQLLIAVGGKGFYQEKNKPARLLLPGDIVEISPNVIHWHGAAPDSWFSHLAIECNPQTNKNTWLEPVDDEEYSAATSPNGELSAEAAKNQSTWYATYHDNLAITDPELAEIFGNFTFGNVAKYGQLETRSRILVTMASTIATNSTTEYRKTLHAALANGITPLEIKEVLYHAVPYAGMSKVEELIEVANDFLSEKGVKLPLAPQSVVTPATRMEKGLALQKDIFGNQIDHLYETSPANQLHIQKYLSANCFGDYQTRPVFDPKTRELLTFAILISLGGCEPQVKGHIAGNVNVGNDKQTLLTVATQLLPYIGYPRTLNAIACLNEVIPEN